MSINGINNSYAVGTAAYIKNQTAAAVEKSAASPAGSVRSQDTVTISAEAKAAQSAANVGSSSTTAATSGTTTFTSSVDQLVAKDLEHMAMVNKYYEAQHQENMRFSDPKQHIRDKYKNENSQYFRNDMTEREREFAYKQEILYLATGRLEYSYRDDYALRSVRGYGNIATQEVVSNQNARDQIEGAVADALTKNGITLPEGASFRLSVDPYDHYISVLGLEDTSIAKLIEQVLNTGNNGHNLYQHILACNPEKFGYDTPEQYTKLDLQKSGLFQMVKDQTGLDIRTLERKNGAILTPDGKDLWEVLEEIAKTLPIGDGKKGADFSYYKPAYDAVAKYGWSDGSGLALEYRNGSLYDIGTEYGYGDEQNGWTEWVLANPEAASMQMMPWVERQAIELQVQREDDE